MEDTCEVTAQTRQGRIGAFNVGEHEGNPAIVAFVVGKKQAGDCDLRGKGRDHETLAPMHCWRNKVGAWGDSLDERATPVRGLETHGYARRKSAGLRNGCNHRSA